MEQVSKSKPMSANGSNVVVTEPDGDTTIYHARKNGDDQIILLCGKPHYKEKTEVKRIICCAPTFLMTALADIAADYPREFIAAFAHFMAMRPSPPDESK